MLSIEADKQLVRLPKRNDSLSLGNRQPDFKQPLQVRQEQNRLYLESRDMILDHLYDKYKGLTTEINWLRIVGRTKFKSANMIGVPNSTNMNYCLLVAKTGRYWFIEFENNTKDKWDVKAIID